MPESPLTYLGLNPEQAEVYKTLLEKQKMTASTIAHKTSIKRAHTYKTLEELIDMGLVTKTDKPGRITTYAAEHPRKLEELVEQKQHDYETAQAMLEQELPDLSSQYNLVAGKPNVRFFEGEDGIQKTLDDSLTSQTPIYSYGDLEAIQTYIPEINKAYVKKRSQKGLQKKGIALDTPYARKFLKNYHPDVTETKLIAHKDAPPFQTVMQIYDNKISYITLGKENMIGVIVEDEHIYTMHKYLFEYLWGITPELDLEAV